MTSIHNAGFFAIATKRSVVVRASRVSLVVGVVLAMINHGDRLFTSQVDVMTLIKIGLSFLVPYCVSTFSSVLAVREHMQMIDPIESH